jgi:hypothetical protein
MRERIPTVSHIRQVNVGALDNPITALESARIERLQIGSGVGAGFGLFVGNN